MVEINLYSSYNSSLIWKSFQNKKFKYMYGKKTQEGNTKMF